jgi:hypothetical protein
MAIAFAAELFVGDGRNFDVQINAIEQRSADLCEIALDDAGRTAALARDITVEAARTPVQISTAPLTAFIVSPPVGERPDVAGFAPGGAGGSHAYKKDPINK